MHALRYLIVLIATVAAAHLAWSAGVVALLHGFYEHRIPNVRKFPNAGAEWEDFTSAFAIASAARSRAGGRPGVMFLGSSMTWGYPWQEPVIFSKLTARAAPDWTVSNLSVIGAGILTLGQISHCALGDKQRQPDVLVVEIPLVNAVSQVRGHGNSPQPCHRSGSDVPGEWRLALMRPLGVGWLMLLWDEEAYDKPDEPLQVARVPDTYFADQRAFAPIEAAFADQLRAFLTRMSSRGGKVYVYVSPIYTPAIDEAGGDRRSVEHQIELAYRICQEVQGVVCLDTRPFGTQKDLFYNLTHLNQRGHRALADWFVRQIRP
jgi:hypothetical protein